MIKNYLSTNSKLRKSGIFSWGIPAYRAPDGTITCPGASACVTGCYARAGFYVMPNVLAAQQARLDLSRNEQFVAVMNAEIKRRDIKRLRIHDSGDFYSRQYLNAWLAIISMNEQTLFYAYTKMIPLFSGVTLPKNFIVIFSEGGRWDNQIKPTDRHSRVFWTVAELKRAKYADAHKFDHNAFGKNHRIGLVYHGAESKRWVTS